MNGSMYPNADYDNVVLNGDWPGSGPWFGWGLPLLMRMVMAYLQVH